MSHPESENISGISRWYSLCLLIIPSILIIIFLVGSIPFSPLTIGFATFVVLVLLLMGISLPLITDKNYRSRLTNWFQRRIKIRTEFEIQENLESTPLSPTLVMPKLQTEDGTPVPVMFTEETPLKIVRSLTDVINQLPELEAMVEELNTHISPHHTSRFSFALREKLVIEKSAANSLLASLLTQYSKKTISKKYFQQKRANLLQTIKKLDIALDEVQSNSTPEIPP
ncbi:MAG: hypothetical protein ACFFD8_09255 [Candidatus Thorarchaeota archaeon]